MRSSAPPAERVRHRLARAAGATLARAMPSGYQRLGRVLILRLPEELRPYFPEIGQGWCDELHVATVLHIRGAVRGEAREPSVEIIAGEETEAEVVEHGVRYRLDAARLLFARGNRTERQRIGRLVSPGETVVDLFAGIGYFTLPAALHGADRVVAVEKNPIAFHYLGVNAALNGVAERVVPVLGDNRVVAFPRAKADRVILGYLPSSLPWISLALTCLKPEGGWLHVHLVAGVRESREDSEHKVTTALRPAIVREIQRREVKAYGPGRSHVVVDALVLPSRR